MPLNPNEAHVCFRDRHGKMHKYFFRSAIEIYQTYEISEVIHCVKKAEQASAKGHFVVGYISYEAASAFDYRLITKAGTKWPLVWFAVYEKAESYPLFSAESTSNYKLGPWISDTSKQRYSESIKTIREQIEDGITYQTNYTIRLQAEFEGSDFDFYQNLCNVQNASYTAYINLGDLRILSVSPELFFELDNDYITTRPMKGTAARGRWYEEDIANQESLRTSLKDLAENVMIVDLLRNDLGRIAEIDSIRVPKLFSIEQYPTVFQMTSEIVARTNADLVEILTAMFPCGSITGAPKVSTMQVIERIESSPREVYCGAIGLMMPNKHYIFNVAIRTVLIDAKEGLAEYGVGGGITWDSSSQAEYQEIINKSAILQKKANHFQLLETMVCDNGEYFLFAFHMERMRRSAQYYGYRFQEKEIVAHLNELAANVASKIKVRLLLFETGDFELQHSRLDDQNEDQIVSLAMECIYSTNPSLFHKTTNREVYKARKDECCFDTLLWNERGEITEFTTGNVVVKMNDTFYTPPIESGLLPGTFRRHLIDNRQIVERTIMVSELNQAQEIWFINSVRGWIRARLGSPNSIVME
jgi:para-aminobenzoate synthetase / 4-amino-4-deoxychorismate lyase